MMRLALALLTASTLFAAGELSNRRAPGFALYDPSLKLHDPADHRGKVVIVEFMQTNCPHCAAFSKVLNSIKTKYAGRVEVIAIANQPSTAESIRKFMTDNKPNYPLVFDCGQVAFSFIQPKSGSVPIPHVFLVDQQGMIRYDVAYTDATKNMFEGSGLYTEIDKLLKPAAPAPAKK